MRPTTSPKTYALWHPHHWMPNNLTKGPSKKGDQTLHRAPPIIAVTMGLILVGLLIGAVASDTVKPPHLPAEECPCTEMTVANILRTGADGECVDVPHAAIFTHAGDNSVYITSHNLCTVSDPPNRNVEWTAIKNDGEFAACRRVVLEAADAMGIPCNDTYHPTPSRKPVHTSPAS